MVEGEPIIRSIRTSTWSVTSALLLVFFAHSGARVAETESPATAEEDWTPLMIAAAALLRLGAKPDVVDGEGATALLRASGAHRGAEIVRALIDGGADVNAGLTSFTPLAVAAGEGDVEIVGLLLERGADVNAKFRVKSLEGLTPLMLAALEGHLEVVNLLAAHGADLNARNSGGTTARGLATVKGHQEIVDALAAAGAEE